MTYDETDRLHHLSSITHRSFTDGNWVVVLDAGLKRNFGSLDEVKVVWEAAGYAA